jgi:hypothetical protein
MGTILFFENFYHLSRNILLKTLFHNVPLSTVIPEKCSGCQCQVLKSICKENINHRLTPVCQFV